MAVDARTAECKTALHHAAEQGYTDIVDVLLKSGAAVDATDVGGWAPLHYACLGGWPQYESHTRIVRMLLVAPCSVALIDAGGWTALHVCTDATAAQLLLAADARLAVMPDRDGRQPLHFVNAEITQLLMQTHGVDVNACDRYRRTPLHLCTHSDKARVLLAQGADLTAVDEGGHTALDWCRSQDREDMWQYLQSIGAPSGRPVPVPGSGSGSHGPSSTCPVPTATNEVALTTARAKSGGRCIIA